MNERPLTRSVSSVVAESSIKNSGRLHTGNGSRVMYSAGMKFTHQWFEKKNYNYNKPHPLRSE